MSRLFATTLFLSAGLLFCVQPMAAKGVLPLLGGSPAVWNTCTVFFQAALLAGYAYAHASTNRLGHRRQAWLQLAIVALPLLVLPFGLAPDRFQSLPPESNPIPWLVGLLAITVGPPFLALSTTAPVLQRWFAASGRPGSENPYPLYSASNLGSMLALVAYPVAIEPWLKLADQAWLWAAGYGLLLVLTAACAWTSLRKPAVIAEAPPAITPDADPIAWKTWLGWVGLAFPASSLMLGVTTYLSTDIASMPLLWIVPLALYLLSFILVFARRPVGTEFWSVKGLPMAAGVLVFALSLGSADLFWMPVHLLGFFAACMACHGELARRRPPAQNLTAYYLAMSVGGVLGGLFNALIAPYLFDRIAEYPIALVLACLVRPRRKTEADAARTAAGNLWQGRLDLLLPAALLVTILGLAPEIPGNDGRSGPSPSTQSAEVLVKLTFGLGVLVAYMWADRPLRFGLGLAAVLAAGTLFPDHSGRILLQERSLFGVLRVALVSNEGGTFHRLIHGSTLHGQQNLDPARRRDPQTYYHRDGPAGQIFALHGSGPAGTSVGVVGLGVGSLSAYARAGESWTFYEIDPAVARVARDPAFFTYLADCPAGRPRIILGDARLRLREAPDGSFGLIVLDAFSSDAVPVHMLTREALALYRRKLAPGGRLAFHISNRFFDLGSVLGTLAADSGWAVRVWSDLAVTPEQERAGHSASVWAVLAASDVGLGSLANDAAWVVPARRPGEAPWTDDYSNLLGRLRVLDDPRGGFIKP